MGQKVRNGHHGSHNAHHAGGASHGGASHGGASHGGDAPNFSGAPHPVMLHRIATRHRVAVLVILVVATLAFLSTWWW